MNFCLLLYYSHLSSGFICSSHTLKQFFIIPPLQRRKVKLREVK